MLCLNLHQKTTTHNSITKPCDEWGKTEEAAGQAAKQETNQESIHLDAPKHNSHHNPCPANSTTVDAAEVERKSRREAGQTGEAQNVDVIAQPHKKMKNFRVSQAEWSTKEYQIHD